MHRVVASRPRATPAAAITAIIEAINVTDLDESLGQSPLLYIEIFVDDEKTSRNKIDLENCHSTFRLLEPIRIIVNPSSILMVKVYNSRMNIPGREPLIGGISKRISELGIETYCCYLNGIDSSAGNIKIWLKIDTSTPLTVDELGLELASQKMDRALGSLGRTSNVVDRVVGSAAMAQSGYSSAQQANDYLGPLGDALKHLDKVVQFMDGIAAVHPIHKVAWTVLSSVYKALKQQLGQNANIQILAVQLRDVLAYAEECCELQAITGGTDTIREMGRLVVEGGSLIDECMKHGFLLRIVKSAFSSDLQTRINQCQNKLSSIEKKFLITLTIRAYNDTAGNEEVLEWLCIEKFDTRHVEIRNIRLGNTGKWIVNALEQQDWKSKKGLLLLGVGDPGVGKTFLCSVAIDYMLSLAAGRDYGVAYFYFSIDRPNEQSFHHVLSCLAKQLTAQAAQLPKSVERLYQPTIYEGVIVAEFTKARPTTDELQNMIVSITKSKTFSRIFFIFDALDECKQSLRHDFLSFFKDMTDQGINVFITSRPNLREINPPPHNAVTIKLSAKDDDLKIYIQNRINSVPCTRDLLSENHRREEVVTAITQYANGIFLFAGYCTDRLLDIGTERGLIEEPRGMKESPGNRDYGVIYDKIIERIRKQPKPAAELALRILCWLTMAWRVLSIEELQVAVSVKPNGLGDLQTPERLIEVCAGLAVMDKETDTVRLSHATVREYLLEKPGVLPEDPNWVLVEACLTYLSFDVFKDGACSEYDEFVDRISSHPLLYYAAKHIEQRSRIRYEGLSTDVIHEFLDNRGSLSSYLQVVMCEGRADGFHAYPKDHGALHVACRIGHVSAVRWLIDRGAAVMACDSDRRFPLHITAESGNSAIAELLVEKGAETSVQDERGWTPLHMAALEGHEAVVKLLLANGAETSVQDERGWTPLHMAALEGHEAVAKLLLANGAETSVQDKSGSTPLHRAAEKAYEAVVKILLEKGAEPSLQNKDGWTPLHWAAFNEDEAVVKLLLENDAEISVADKHGWMPLHLAVSNGSKAIVEILLENYAETSVADKNGLTPLHFAASNGSKAIVEILLENDAEISVQDKDGQSPLHFAASIGRKAIVKLLLENGAELSLQDKHKCTPLHLAASKGHEAVVKVLLEKGAKTSVKDENWRTPLCRAALGGHKAVVKILEQC